MDIPPHPPPGQPLWEEIKYSPLHHLLSPNCTLLQKQYYTAQAQRVPWSWEAPSALYTHTSERSTLELDIQWPQTCSTTHVYSISYVSTVTSLHALQRWSQHAQETFPSIRTRSGVSGTRTDLQFSNPTRIQKKGTRLGKSEFKVSPH